MLSSEQDQERGQNYANSLQVAIKEWFLKFTRTLVVPSTLNPQHCSVLE